MGLIRGLSIAALVFSSAIPAFCQAITTIEANQALGRQLNGALNFVAGKDTAIRVYLDSAVQINTDQTSLAIQRDGQAIVTLTPPVYTAPTNTVEFRCPSRTACGSWAAGSYVFTATVNGVTMSTQGTTYNFVPRIGLRILVRPVKANYNGTITSVKGDAWKTAWTFTRSVYPIAADQIFWDVREEFDLSASQYNLETDDGRLAVWQALTNLMPEHCAANPKSTGCYDLVVGFISDRPNTYPNGTLQGYTYGRPTNIVVASDEDMPATISHEIGHIYGVGDTYDGGSLNCGVNPSPDGVNGKDYNNPANSASCTAGKVTFPGASATKILADDQPYEVDNRGALGDRADFMGSGTTQSNYWITPEVYNQIFVGLDPAKSQVPTGVDAAHYQSPRPLASAQRLLLYTGLMNAQGQTRIQPWYSLSSTEPAADTTGDTQIQAVDASGTLLASQAIHLQFFVLSNPPTTVVWAPFEGALRFPDGAAKIQIVQKGSVVYEAKVSAHDPVVSGVSPTAAATTLDGPQTITWTASDPDGDALNYIVEYNPRPTDPTSEWLVLASDITSPQWMVDFGILPGTAAGAIRISATDGIRSAVATSQTFAVSFKPPLVSIDESTGTVFTGAAVIRLSGEADDVQDGTIENQGLVWTSDVSGNLGSGSEIALTKLPLGNHTITLTATNSAGLTASQSIKITVQ